MDLDTRAYQARWPLSRAVGIVSHAECDEYGKDKDDDEQDERGCPEQALPMSPLRGRRIIARHAGWGEVRVARA